MLDLFTTPGVGATDAALAVNATLNDPDYGIQVTPVARGGVEPAQYLDVQVTLSAPAQVITAWGASDGSSVQPPFGLTDVQSITAGFDFGLAIKSDGSVIAWGGNNQFGQLNVPADLGPVTAVATGGQSVCGALQRDGTVRLWGGTFWGNGNSANLAVPLPPLSGVRQISVGGHLLALARTSMALCTPGADSMAPVNSTCRRV